MILKTTKKELRLWLMENTRNDALDRKEAFSAVTREDMIEFVKNLRESAWCQMQVEGNFYEKEATKLYDSAIKTLGGKYPYYLKTFTKYFYVNRICKYSFEVLRFYKWF